MAYPPVVIVDEQDRVVGSAMLAEAWEKGLIYRLVMVVVEDSQGHVLLHRRSPSMKLFPNRWDTVGGHVDVTPDYLKSAQMELREEAGIEHAELEKLAHEYTEELYDGGVLGKRFVTIYRARYDGEPGVANDDEVVEMRWFSREEIAELAKHHEQVAECLRRCLPYIVPAPVSATIR